MRASLIVSRLELVVTSMPAAHPQWDGFVRSVRTYRDQIDAVAAKRKE